MKRHHYTPEELNQAAIADQIADAEQNEYQAEHGPYFPDKGITRGSLLRYAVACRQRATSLAPK